jgi:hypothetical protein
VQVATAELDEQKPKVIIAKKELTAVLLSFDPFRNVRVSAEHAAINGLTGRESNVELDIWTRIRCEIGCWVGWVKGGMGWWVLGRLQLHQFLPLSAACLCSNVYNDDIYVTLLLRHFFIELQDAHRQRFTS